MYKTTYCHFLMYSYFIVSKNHGYEGRKPQNKKSSNCLPCPAKSICENCSDWEVS